MQLTIFHRNYKIFFQDPLWQSYEILFWNLVLFTEAWFPNKPITSFFHWKLESFQYNTGLTIARTIKDTSSELAMDISQFQSWISFQLHSTVNI